MDSRLTFKSHLHQVVQRAKATWAFAKRQAKKFNCPYVAKALYCALVRSKLEYCSVVWSPTFECDKVRLESVQKQFLLFALRHLNWQDPFVLPPYDARLGLLNLESLVDRRTMADFQLARSLLTEPSTISICPPNLEFVPSRTRATVIPKPRHQVCGRI